MTTNRIDIFDHDRAVDSVQTDDSEELANYSGPLNRELVVQGVPLYALWVCAAVRSGRVRVTIEFTVAASTSYEVSEGRPLFLETEVGTEGQTVSLITFTPLSRSPHLESSVLVSDRAMTGEPPVPQQQILGLRADLGVTGSPAVTAWADVSPGAPNVSPFNAVGGNPQLIVTDIEFNDQPTIQFDASSRLEYSGAILDFDVLATGPTFTVAVTHSPDDDLSNIGALISNAIGAAAGTSIRVLETYETRCVTANGLPNESFEAQFVEPLHRAMITIWTVVLGDGVQDGGGLGLQQGYVAESNDDPYESSQSPASLLNIGGDPDGSNQYKGRIADIRVYTPALTTPQAQSYVEYAVARFTVDNTLYRNNAETSDVLYLTASRGLTTVGGAIRQYALLGQVIGVNVPDGDYINVPQMATTGSGTGATATFRIESGSIFGNLVWVHAPGQGHTTSDTISFLAAPGDDSVDVPITIIADVVTDWDPVNNPSTGSFQQGVRPPYVAEGIGGNTIINWPDETSVLGQRDIELISSDLNSFYNLLVGHSNFTLALVFRAIETSDDFPERRIQPALRQREEEGGIGSCGMIMGMLPVGESVLPRGVRTQVKNITDVLQNWTINVERPDTNYVAYVHRYNEAAGEITVNVNRETVETTPRIDVANGVPTFSLTIGGSSESGDEDYPFIGGFFEIHISSTIWTDEQVADFIDYAAERYQIDG